ncbi:bacterio-opsin activator domain-containing protein [Halolamina salifodinae]|uniref:DNA-binding NarL/FixJ family response regulator/GAF domain-containing protein n=2 Tax=Halolamina salifodinae TaxID=1202767 RepID=A0A8T4GUG5_9EURY|nr:bacterio-opsin activator domain-containing protein [Halolamina salifodinae]MBP1986509.1 DNA-binding NarL/FixJ family response regulator/GAF domain-containing protein [Halolamina salifodinae]
MSESELEVLLVEDNPGDARLIEEMLHDAETLLERVDLGASTAGSLRIHSEQSLQAGISRLNRVAVDVVLLDLGLPDSTGMETLTSVIDIAGRVPVIVLTGLQDERVGIEAIKHGAQDYLVKDEVSSELLVRSIHHAIERNRQELERTRRHRQLEALNSFTRELMDAETPAAVGERVVDAAADRLGLPVMAVALYDADVGELRPAATTSAADALDIGALLSAPDAPGWRAFAEGGDPVTIANESVPEGVSELALFPMGSHGVLLVGTPTQNGISAADFDFVGSVAGNVESALDRVEREREREEREQLLEEQNRTLERLNRINDIIRSISRALVRASTREEIETVACEELAGAGPYGLAWIGEIDRTDEVVIRERAGADSGVEADGIGALAGPASPSDSAVRDRSPQIVNDVLGDGEFEPWQRAALDRGYHATASFPLEYEDAVYGTLSVYAEQTGVFGDLERAVLAELADTIAYAINAAESKKALTGAEVTRLEFDVSETDIPFVRLARDLDASLVAENFVFESDGGVRRFLTTRGVPAEAVLEGAETLPVREFTLVSSYKVDSEPVCLFRAGVSEESPEATMLEHGARPLELSAGGGEATVVAELGADAPVREFVDLFTDRFPGTSLTAQRSVQRTDRSVAQQRASVTETLTDRQLEAIRTAFFSGYFDRPRKHTGTEIAEAMGISQPTFSHHLREAQRRLCASLFGDGAADATADDGE